jgi:hypothetical protein
MTITELLEGGCDSTDLVVTALSRRAAVTNRHIWTTALAAVIIAATRVRAGRALGTGGADWAVTTEQPELTSTDPTVMHGQAVLAGERDP